MKYFFFSLSSYRLNDIVGKQWSMHQTETLLSTLKLPKIWWRIQLLKHELEHPKKSKVFFWFSNVF